MTPSPWVDRWLRTRAPGTTVLDVACGRGRHVRLARALGLAVTAIDRDTDALATLPTDVEMLAADLEHGPWPCEGRCFDAVVVTHYLHRPLFDALIASVAPGGVLIYETFADGQAHYGRPARPDYLLARGELYTRVHGALHVLAFEDGVVVHPTAARVQRIAALRPNEADDLRAPLEAAAL